MKVTGFTIVRNAVKFDYPIIESISSILPIVDEFVVLVGQSEDSTLELIKNINSPKIKIYESLWDDSIRKGGKVLAIETDKAFAKISEDTDWAFYLQSDEIVHEKDLPEIQNAMEKYLNIPRVEGFLFNYYHFYGSYDYLGASYRWYRREVRIIRNNKKIKSYNDAKGFRWENGKKLNVIPLNAHIYHYGWVRNPKAMQEKTEAFHKLYHENIDFFPKRELFDYSEIDALKKFEGTHPKVMHKRISEKNWSFDYDFSFNHFSLKDKLKKIMEKITGWQIGEPRNFKILKN